MYSSFNDDQRSFDTVVVIGAKLTVKGTASKKTVQRVVCEVCSVSFEFDTMNGTVRLMKPICDECEKIRHIRDDQREREEWR